MRQGTDMVLEVEPSNVWDDNISKQSVLTVFANFPMQAGTPYLQELGFGNPMGGQVSTWEYINVMVANGLSTTLPYWPPVPPAPVLMFDDNGPGNNQGVTVSSYLKGLGLINTVSASVELDADGTTYTGAVRNTPGDEYWEFTGLGAGQTVTSRVILTDVSGRSVTSPDVMQIIPTR